MNVQYCEEHRNLGDADGCFCGPNQYCRMVPMRLIPDNAQLRERMKQAVIQGMLKGKEGFANAVSVDVVTDYVLAALDGETP